MDASTKKKTDALAADMVEGALSSKSIINFTGGEMSIDSLDSATGAK